MDPEKFANPFAVQLSTCRHKYHFDCLEKNFMDKYDTSLPLWVAMCCPLCKTAANMPFKIIESSTIDQKKISIDFYD